MAKTDFKSVDEYIASQPKLVQERLERVRSAIRKAVPAGEEVISYKIPTFKLHGRPVIYFAGWKQHYSIYPASGRLVAALQDELASYEVRKGTIRFSLAQPVPVKLIGRIAKLRANEVSENMKAKAPASKKAAPAPRASKKSGAAVGYIKRHKDGSLWAKGQVLDGAATGYWEWFRKDGTRMRSGYFKDGEQTGEWTTYDRNGEVYKVTTIKAKTAK